MSNSLTTGAVARILSVHPNTLRWYEAAGYLPSVPRAANGYRRFSRELVRLARIVRTSQPLLPLYGAIRRAALTFLATCKEECIARERGSGSCCGPYHASLQCLETLTGLLREEHRLALEALAALDRFRRGDSVEALEGDGEAVKFCGRPLRFIGAAAFRTGLSRDQIIGWERNGLVRYPRSNTGYRLFGPQEIDRLLIIRSCRTAGYSLTGIRRLVRAIDSEPPSHSESLRTIADTPTAHESRLFPAFPTDTLPVTLEQMIMLTSQLRELLR